MKLSRLFLLALDQFTQAIRDKAVKVNRPPKAYGDSWADVHISYLEERFKDEFSEAFESDAKPEEYVDVAMVAMFLWWRKTKGMVP